MNDIRKYIDKKAKTDPEIYDRIVKESSNLDIAIALQNFRQSYGLSQREFANIVAKPQSTIARIENGNMSPSTKTLTEIASKFNKRVKFDFV
ncbi:Helix-turn-helix [Propionispira arboris]|uniref:Helix-turn-helix n=1 Tax=Propionispira arboris TaxID=84035 RepID=A0A1H7CQK8_9FIRM|nr:MULTISPECIES: helix-turn-helix transcriptional regulator [Propionispira]SEJ89020.1 Helix-turn-helix [Propionispira arboris]